MSIYANSMLSQVSFYRESNRLCKLSIFLVALSLRISLGTIFFGSVDTINSMNNAVRMFHHQAFTLPYFPLVKAFIWLGGYLIAFTPLPIGLCVKIVPIIFDSLIAVLIFDLLTTYKNKNAFLYGILYACCPVPLLINCIHGQWDSIFLFFLLMAFFIRDLPQHPLRNHFIFGCSFALSILAKPVAIMMLPFYFDSIPLRHRFSFFKMQMYSCIGTAITFLSSLILFKCFGVNLHDTFGRVFLYAENKPAAFGLSTVPPLSSFNFAHAGHTVFLLICALSYFYYKNYIYSFQALLLGFLVVIGVGGLAPQYLLWVIPFLFINDYPWFTAGYTSLTGIFLVLYYLNPLVSISPGENMLAFVTLNIFSFFMPPQFLTNTVLTFYPLKILGSYVIPLFALISLLIILFKRKQRTSFVETTNQLDKFRLYIYSIIIIAAVVIACYLNYIDYHGIPFELQTNMFNKLHQYHLEIQGNMYKLDFPAAINFFNAAYVFFAAIFMWSFFLIKRAYRH